MALDLDTFFPGIRSSYNSKVLDFMEPDLRGPSSLISKQLITQSYSPKISIISTSNADNIAAIYGYSNFLNLLSYFENSQFDNDQGTSPLSVGMPYRITVRFTKPISLQLKEQEPQSIDINSSTIVGKSINLKSPFSELYDATEFNQSMITYIDSIDEAIKNTQFLEEMKSLQNFKTTELETEGQMESTILQNSIYLKLLTKIVSSPILSPFETFNHPIIQLFVVTATDDITLIVAEITNWKKHKLPKWIDFDSILPVVLIVTDRDDQENIQRGLKIQEHLKVNLSIKSAIMSLNTKPEEGKDTVTVNPSAFSLAYRPANSLDTDTPVKIDKGVFDTIYAQLLELNTSILIPHMERKIKLWNEEVVAPRKSLTGRLFGGKKWGASSSQKKSFFSFGSSNSTPDLTQTPSFNSVEGFYYGDSNEMIIRRLGDWCFMLRDYKTSYTTYELLKKDFLNDKAYSYLASIQEFMIISLLVGASNKLNPLDNTTSTTSGGITTKIVSDVITPLFESSFYSYLSRCNMKTYTVRLTLVLAELYLLLGQSAAFAKLPSSALKPETYYAESMKLFEKLINSKLLENTSNAKLMERISYIYFYHDKPLRSDTEENRSADIQYEPYYEEENPMKISKPSMATLGLSKKRKSVLWLLLASRELDPEVRPVQAKVLLYCIEKELYDGEGVNNSNFQRQTWLYRDNSILHNLKDKLYR